jgi:hypothetical protein
MVFFINSLWMAFTTLGIPIIASRRMGPLVLSSHEAAYELGIAAGVIGCAFNLWMLRRGRHKPTQRIACKGWMGLHVILILAYTAALKGWIPLG